MVPWRCLHWAQTMAGRTGLADRTTRRVTFSLYLRAHPALSRQALSPRRKVFPTSVICAELPTSLWLRRSQGLRLERARTHMSALLSTVYRSSSHLTESLRQSIWTKARSNGKFHLVRRRMLSVTVRRSKGSRFRPLARPDSALERWLQRPC